jgi:hypothetical protein
MATYEQDQAYDPDRDPDGVGVEQDQRAIEHRARALAALDHDRPDVAVVEALLALEARLEESTHYLAQLT